jgi:multisubunit Na+/H+ antiporter MnhC subunit
MRQKNLYRIITGMSIIIGGIVTLLLIPGELALPQRGC